jgi:hypothetical protein
MDNLGKVHHNLPIIPMQNMSTANTHRSGCVVQRKHEKAATLPLLIAGSLIPARVWMKL